MRFALGQCIVQCCESWRRVTEKYHLAEEPFNVYTEYVAARTIQKYFRGYITRKYINHLHDSAIVIQRNWRGVLGRKLFFKRIKEKLDIMCQNYYNRAAITIQALFRGYYVRKYVFSFYDLKEIIKNISKKNVELTNKIEEFKQGCLEKIEKDEEIESEKQIKLIIFKLHHLLRTYQIEGIYSKKKTSEYSCIEKMMKKIKFKEYMKENYTKSQQQSLHYDEENFIFKGIWRKCENAWVHRNDPGKYSIFNSGVYGEEENLRAVEEFCANYINNIQDEPMSFKKITKNEDMRDTLAWKEYKCTHSQKFFKGN